MLGLKGSIFWSTRDQVNIDLFNSVWTKTRFRNGCPFTTLQLLLRSPFFISRLGFTCGDLMKREARQSDSDFFGITERDRLLPILKKNLSTLIAQYKYT
jgi:hypothetical protein